MTFQTLDYIIAIAEERSISRAADRLLISQPALSRQLKRLEDQLGRKAFRAGTQRNAPDDAGKIYVNGARTIQNIHEHALEDIHKLSQSGRRQITFIYNNILLPNFSSEYSPGIPKTASPHPDQYHPRQCNHCQRLSFQRYGGSGCGRHRRSCPQHAGIYPAPEED